MGSFFHRKRGALDTPPCFREALQTVDQSCSHAVSHASICPRDIRHILLGTALIRYSEIDFILQRNKIL
jgi:hypothetical protein